MSLQQSSCKMHFVTVHSMYGLLSPIARFLSSLADRGGMHHNYSRTYFSRGDFKIGVTAPSPLENLYGYASTYSSLVCTPHHFI